MASNHAAVKALIRQISGQANVLAIPRVFITLTRDIKAALLLSQIVYWSDKGGRGDGWFYKSADEWKAELGLTRGEVTRATKRLAPWVSTKLARANAAPTLHYSVDMEKLTAALVKLLETEPAPAAKGQSAPAPILTKQQNRFSQNSKIELDETAKSDLNKTAKTLTKTTQNLPPEIKAERESGEKPARPPSQNDEKKNALYPIAEALAEVCVMDLQANKGRIFETAATLAASQPPATAELLRLHYGSDPGSYWTARDWRGAKGEEPGLAAIRETWGKWTRPAPSARARGSIGQNTVNGQLRREGRLNNNQPTQEQIEFDRILKSERERVRALKAAETAEPTQAHDIAVRLSQRANSPQ